MARVPIVARKWKMNWATEESLALVGALLLTFAEIDIVERLKLSKLLLHK